MIAQLTDKIASLSKKQQKEVLKYVNSLLKKAKENASPLQPYYNPNQVEYTVEDIKNIIAKFPKNKKWTWHDLQNPLYFPELVKFKVELLKYKIYIMRPSAIHQKILTRLSAFMEVYAFTNDLGDIYVAPVGVHIEEGTTLEPDILFVAVQRKHIITKDGTKEAPDFVVEVISRANYKKLREQKKTQYAQFGVQEYWEIHPKKQKITIETLTQDADGKPTYEIFSEAKKVGKIQSTVLQGFELDIEKIFKV
ncbi:MAG: Uma2 family endonuclease [Bacteroidetes bacterium]|nr:MAG: Uma2 family endonuclease [Bacteroidota bacterium]